MFIDKKNKDNKSNGCKNLLMQDYRMFVENDMQDINKIESLIEIYSNFSLEQLENFRQFCKEKQLILMKLKEKTGSYVVSKQNPIDMDYINTTLDIIALNGYIPLETEVAKSVSLFEKEFEENRNYQNLNDEELEELKNKFLRNKTYIITQWLMRAQWFYPEEYEKLINNSTELKVVNKEIDKRQKQEKGKVKQKK